MRIILIKIQAVILFRDRKADSKVYIEGEWSKMAKTILKKNIVKGLTLFNFKTYYKAMTI